MGNEIEVKGMIGLDPPNTPLANEQSLIEKSKPSTIRMNTTVYKQYPQTNDSKDTHLQLAGIWLILVTILVWHLRKQLSKEKVRIKKE